MMALSRRFDCNPGSIFRILKNRTYRAEALTASTLASISHVSTLGTGQVPPQHTLPVGARKDAGNVTSSVSLST